ncbi:hypothetical protein BBJ28_00005307 [Nothophytophthora sp. Chile5]|nr:hypothetical protein BBJ28_00005307 [Nothophytophthora sp. Chile5]
MYTASLVLHFILENPYQMDRAECESFLAQDGSDDLVVRYEWDGEALGLELLRLPSPNVTRTIHWGAGSLGVTLEIDEASRRLVVTRTDRSDVRVGDVLLQARGEPVMEDTWVKLLAELRREHELCPGIPFVFGPPPPPIYVKNCGGALQQAGVDSSFELRYVDGCAVRYLAMEELEKLLHRAQKPCTMAFVQRKENQFLAVLHRQEQQRQGQQQASQAAVASAGLALAAALVVSIM